ncbi:esterase [Salmonella enterica subsp. enterica]|uniref:Esterase n=1 Tax=Salmonella enterica I TaxID=59201 RepID=A0A379W5D4_SALET|nr:esterase [Salmonella enterica subsp. enterica]
MQVMLNGGGYGNVKLFDNKTVAQFTRRSPEDATFGLGWRVNGNASMTPHVRGISQSANVWTYRMDRNADVYRSG